MGDVHLPWPKVEALSKDRECLDGLPLRLMMIHGIVGPLTFFLPVVWCKATGSHHEDRVRDQCFWG